MSRIKASFGRFGKKVKGAFHSSTDSITSKFGPPKPKAGLGELPEEILEPLLEYFPPGRLAKLLRLNKALYRIGLRILYRYIYIHHPHREILLYKTLIEDKERRLAPFIKEFRRSTHTQFLCNKKAGICRSLVPYVEKKFETTLTGLQGKALALAVNLQSLEIALGPLVAFRANNPPSADDPENDPFAHVRWLLDGTIKLKKLVVHPLVIKQGWYRPQEADFSQYLETLLRAQPSIEHLDLSDISYTVSFQDLLPNLQSFKAQDTATLVNALSRERPVKKLAWKNGLLSGLEAAVKQIVTKQGGERVLELTWEGTMLRKDEETPDLDFIPSQLPNLQVLKLGLTTRDLDGFFKNVHKLLALSSHLVKLDLDGSNDPKAKVEGVESLMKAQGGKAFTFKVPEPENPEELLEIDNDGNPIMPKNPVVLAVAGGASKVAAAFSRDKTATDSKADQDTAPKEPDGPFMSGEDGKAIEVKDYVQEIFEREEGFVIEFHKKCPTLLHIVLPNGHYWFRQDFEDKWTQSSLLRGHRDFWLFKGDPPLPMDRWDKISCVDMAGTLNHPLIGFE